MKFSKFCLSMQLLKVKFHFFSSFFGFMLVSLCILRYSLNLYSISHLTPYYTCFISTFSFLKYCPICSFHNHYPQKNETKPVNILSNSFIFLMIKTLKNQNVNNCLSNYKENELRLKVKLKTCSFFFPFIIN
jgi:hypothetical protein